MLIRMPYYIGDLKRDPNVGNYESLLCPRENGRKYDTFTARGLLSRHWIVEASGFGLNGAV